MLAVLLSANVVQGASLRCGNRIVSRGDPIPEVWAKCGEAQHVRFWQEVRIKRDFYDLFAPDFDYRPRRAPLYAVEYVALEEWTYNFGSQRFLYYLTFENGVLRQIVSGNYGHEVGP